ncbi:hypothetical protein RI845_03365 [Thalassotalea nanhaiensis]|uniref:Uncharacterized protein n=1 Tax=Thalassotalea nanhaiensis TaxID=3065648 RepID=A0ABY9TKT5_9GAMM|nr:hypothetical protein RI845_03365 [Colwelliaceae bacterium SQ345]
MDRIKDTQKLITELYDEYVASLKITPKPIDFNDIKSIEKVFESIYIGNSKATLNRTPYPQKLSSKLREAFADLLLLMDGVDLNLAKEKQEDATSQ